MMVDNEPGRSSVLHHYPSAHTILEGRRLVPNCALPPKGQRILFSIVDLNKGEEVHSGMEVPDAGEPDLKTLVADDTNPWLFLHWIIVP